MPDSTGEQDLVQALDNVAGVSMPGTQAAGPYGGVQPQSVGAVADPFPPIQQLPEPLPSQPAPAGTAPSFVVNDPVSAVDPAAAASVAAPAEDLGPLGSIKQDALVELRPLVDKLNVSSEEKFDTYLLLIRSTDDSTLIAPAYEAAKQIADETRRAEALLDVIKEIDYLSRPKEG